jgi:hypothetical protein
VTLPADLATSERLLYAVPLGEFVRIVSAGGRAGSTSSTDWCSLRSSAGTGQVVRLQVRLSSPQTSGTAT